MLKQFQDLNENTVKMFYSSQKFEKIMNNIRHLLENIVLVNFVILTDLFCLILCNNLGKQTMHHKPKFKFG